MRYRDVPRAMDWLCSAFGFAVHCVVPAADGSIAYAQLTFAGSMIMLGRVGDAGFDSLMAQPDEIGGAETQIRYFVVDDIERHCARAKAAGARVAMDIEEYDRGGCGYTCRDPEGHVWSFGTLDPWTMSPTATPFRAAILLGGWKGVTLAAACVAAILGAAATRWMPTAPRAAAPHDAAALVIDASLAQQRVEEAAAQAMRQAAQEHAVRDAREQAGLARQAEQDAVRELRQAQGRLGEALAAKQAAERSLAALNERMQIVGKAKLAADQRVLEMGGGLQRQREAWERAVRDARSELEAERAARKQAGLGHELARQELLDQLAVAERERQTALDAFDQMTREQAAKAAGSARTHKRRERPDAAPVSRRPERGAGVGRAARHSRRRMTANPRVGAAVRRKCLEIKGDPDGYEVALVELCRTL